MTARAGQQIALPLDSPAPVAVRMVRERMTADEMREAIARINPPKLPEDEDIPF